MDKGSGMYLYYHIGDKVKKGEKLMTLYSDSKIRLANALDFYEKLQPIK
jgi:thymidine phosphorylase